MHRAGSGGIRRSEGWGNTVDKIEVYIMNNLQIMGVKLHSELINNITINNITIDS